MAVKTIQWKNDRVVMIDQRLLPHKEVHRVCRDYQEVAQAIRETVIRGAPAIGVAAAMGVALGAAKAKVKTFDRDFERIFLTLSKTRPTAVNLFWALERMRKVYTVNRSRGVDVVKRLLKEEAQAIYKEDIAANKQLGKFGAQVLRNARHVMTHCNAGALATAGYGTALGVIRALKEAGREFDVLVNETRPFLQGARLTTWELKKEKIPATLITDNMAGYLMQKGKVDAVVVGCERVAANGEVATKSAPIPSRCWRSGTAFLFTSPGRPRPSTSIVRPEKRFPSSSATARKFPIFSARPWRPRGPRFSIRRST